MHAVVISAGFYLTAAACVLFVHALYILWVIFGALLVGSRPVLRWLHVVALVWGILTELILPCPLTLLEDWLEHKAGIAAYQGGFLVHYLDKLVYPDFSPTVLTIAGVTVCVLNLGFYARRLFSEKLR